MTGKVRGHVIERLTLKIEKNVNKTEINHIGAYLCGHELSELLLCHYNDEIGRENCEILCFKNGCHFNEIGHFDEIGREKNVNKTEIDHIDAYLCGH